MAMKSAYPFRIVPSDSFIYIEGKITRPAELTTGITIAHNGLTNLFNEMKYEINSTEVQRVKKPGITSAMKGYCSYSPADENILQNAAWDITNKNANFMKDDTFSGCIPLKHVFGFCEDYKRILVNCSQQLILNRSMSDTSALHYTSVVGGDMATDSVQTLVKKVKVQLTRVLWKVPVVKVDDRERLRLMKIIDSKKMINCAFRNWELCEYPNLPQTSKHSWMVKTCSQVEKPRCLIIAFLTNTPGSVSDGYSGDYDACSLTNVKAYINSIEYPYEDFNESFDKNLFTMFYQNYVDFQKHYYERNNSQPCLSREKYKELGPFICIDCSRQTDDAKISNVDLRVEIEAANNFPANTAAYYILSCDDAVLFCKVCSVKVSAENKYNIQQLIARAKHIQQLNIGNQQEKPKFQILVHKIEAIRSVLENLKTVFKTISEIESTDTHSGSDAVSLLRSIKNFEFIFCLHVLQEILGLTNALNLYLQHLKEIVKEKYLKTIREKELLNKSVRSLSPASDSDSSIKRRTGLRTDKGVVHTELPIKKRIRKPKDMSEMDIDKTTTLIPVCTGAKNLSEFINTCDIVGAFEHKASERTLTIGLNFARMEENESVTSFASRVEELYYDLCTEVSKDMSEEESRVYKKQLKNQALIIFVNGLPKHLNLALKARDPKTERCSWMLREAVIGSILLVIIALSSAKSPTREVGIVGWSDMKMLNKRGAVTAP
ncbi:hypothetical protein QTP88_001349 [Uroleucon formosanum]